MKKTEFSDKRILIVDDLEFMREAAQSVLSDAGFSGFLHAADGKQALSVYLEHKPELVVLDITMPVMDGLTALKKIRSFDSRAKVVMCSAMGEQEYVIQAILNGAIDFVVKPYTPDRLASAVEIALGR